MQKQCPRIFLLPTVLTHSASGYKKQRAEVIPQHRHALQGLALEISEWWDFPGGPVVKNPPYNAGDKGSILGRGTKIPHASGQLSPRATTTEFACLD